MQNKSAETNDIMPSEILDQYTKCDVSHEDFDRLMNSHLSESQIDMTKKVVHGLVTAIDFDKKVVCVEAGLKSDCRIDMRQFFIENEIESLKIGDVIEVFLDDIDLRQSATILSREKASREKSWTNILQKHEAGENIEGIIFSRTRGGTVVDCSGILAFLPGSQMSSSSDRDGKDASRDISNIVGKKQQFKILKLDKKTRSIIISRRGAVDASMKDYRDALLNGISEGQIVSGVIKNIATYGVFVSLGGELTPDGNGVIDGLLHLTDISWKKIGHPLEEGLKIGDKINVKVLKLNREEGRISLGLKQLDENPWSHIKYKVGDQIECTVKGTTSYGIFVEVEHGVEGLIHSSEISWDRSDSAKKISEFNVGDKIKVAVIEIDLDKHRIALSVKQLSSSPCQTFIDSHNVGDIIEGEVRNITDFGIFVALTDSVDGLVKNADISWSGDHHDIKKSDKVKVMYLGHESYSRINLGIKQLTQDPFVEFGSKIKIGSVLPATILFINNDGVMVELFTNINIFVKRQNLLIDKASRIEDVYHINGKINVEILSYSDISRKIILAQTDSGDAQSSRTFADLINSK
jgi:small subunit ribosomal protein S1